jgi:hypothetical protein
MHDLVSLAEKREAACKEEISALLASRSTMYEAAPARPAAATAAAAAPAAAAADDAEEEQGQQEDEELEQTVEAAAAKIDEADKSMEVAQVRSHVCVRL